MAYEVKFRERVMIYLEKGHTQKEAQEVFGVGTTAIKRWKKQYEETGNLAPKELHRSFRKVDPVKVAAYVKEHPDAYLREIAVVFSCGEHAIREALKKQKISRKKNQRIRRT